MVGVVAIVAAGRAVMVVASVRINSASVVGPALQATSKTPVVTLARKPVKNCLQLITLMVTLL